MSGSKLGSPCPMLRVGRCVVLGGSHVVRGGSLWGLSSIPGGAWAQAVVTVVGTAGCLRLRLTEERIEEAGRLLLLLLLLRGAVCRGVRGVVSHWDGTRAAEYWCPTE